MKRIVTALPDHDEFFPHDDPSYRGLKKGTINVPPKPPQVVKFEQFVGRKFKMFQPAVVAPSEVTWNQVVQDPDLSDIMSRGVLWKKIAKKYMGPDSKCHWNVAKLYEHGISVTSIVIGYAHNGEGWHQHTWGIDMKKGVVETCPSNFENDAYYGMILTREEADAFVKLCKKNRPGAGMVRTRRGGAVLLRFDRFR